MRVEKIEAITIAFFAAFAALWILFVLPFLQTSEWFFNLTPLAAYWLYNIGWLAMFAVVFGIPISFFVDNEITIFGLFRGGIASFFIVSWVYDVLQGPFYLSSAGEVLVPLGTSSLMNTAVDAFWATVWQNVVSGPLLFVLTYFVTPVIAIVLAALLLKPKMFIQVMAR